MAWSLIQFLKNDKIQVETVGRDGWVVWEGRQLAMSKSVPRRLSFWMIVHVDLQVPQADGLSWDVEGTSE